MAVDGTTIYSTGFLVLWLVLVVWEAIWKGIALWKAGRNNHLVWFIVMFVLNTAGILPIIYIVWFAKKKNVARLTPVKNVKRKR